MEVTKVLTNKHPNGEKLHEDIEKVEIFDESILGEVVYRELMNGEWYYFIGDTEVIDKDFQRFIELKEERDDNE